MDFQHLDPGQAYDAVSYEVVYATQRPLFSYLPDRESTRIWRRAAIVSADGKTVTVTQARCYFSPVTGGDSSDVATRSSGVRIRTY